MTKGPTKKPRCPLGKMKNSNTKIKSKELISDSSDDEEPISKKTQAERKTKTKSKETKKEEKPNRAITTCISTDGNKEDGTKGTRAMKKQEKQARITTSQLQRLLRCYPSVTTVAKRKHRMR